MELDIFQIFAEGESNTVEGAGADASATAVDGQGSEAAGSGEPAQAEVTAPTPEERREAFRKSISKGGENMEFFQEAMRDFYGKRLGKMKDMEQREKDTAPILALLGQSYGTELKPAELYAAMMKDDHYFEQESIRTGEEAGTIRERYGQKAAMSEKDRRIEELEEQVKQSVERDNAAEAQRRFNERMNAEIPVCQKLHPEFKFESWADNRLFGRLIANGFSVQEAYETANREALMQEATSKAAKDAEEKVMASIRANGARPRENGQGSQAPAGDGFDPMKLTKAQRDEISRRIMRGEKV